MKSARRDLILTTIAVFAAAIVLKSGIVRLPEPRKDPLMHAPVTVYSDLIHPPLIVRAPRKPFVLKKPNPFGRAPVGEMVSVSLTQYCLRGKTRRDNYVREGIVAADPRVFPLARYVDITIGKKYLGRFLVDDTGRKVKGRTLDIWTSSCDDARQFGRRRGRAVLLVKGVSPNNSETATKQLD